MWHKALIISKNSFWQVIYTLYKPYFITCVTKD